MQPDYDSLVGNMLGMDQARGVKTALSEAYGTNPNIEAELQRVSKTTGVPLSTARNMPNETKRTAYVNGINAFELAQNYPIFARFITNENNARVAHDDVENLTALEKAVRELPDEFGSMTGPTPSVGSYLSGLGQSFTTAAESARQGIRQQFADAFGFEGMSEDAQRRYAAAQMQNRMATPEFESSTAQGIYGGASSVMQMIPAVTAGLANPALAFSMIGLQTQAQAYTKYRLRGAEPGMAFMGSAGEGATEVVTELLPMGFALNRFGKDEFGEFLTGFLLRELPSEQVATVVQDVIDTAVANPDKTWSDYFAERPEAAYQTALGSLVAGGVFGGLNTVGQRMAAREAQAVQSQQDAAYLERITKAAQASELRKRAPDLFERYLAQTADGAPIQEVFIDFDKLTEVLGTAGATPQAVAAQVPSLAPQIEEASLTNGMLRIPVSEFATYFADQPYTQALIENLRSYPGATTLAEANAFFQSDNRDELTDEISRVAQEQTPAILAAAQSQQVGDAILEQLNTTGRFTPDVNRAYAALPRAFFEVMAQRLETTPTELFEAYRPQIVAQGVPGANVLSQGERGGFVPREYTKDGKPVIGLFKNADLSTFLHETGHYFLDSYTDMANSAPALQGDMQVLLDWFGVRDMQTWQTMDLEEQRPHHERFARGFEAYLFEGKAPSMELQSLFARFRAWLISVYRNMAGLGVDLPDSVRGVMDRMLATEDQTRAVQAEHMARPLFRSPEEMGATPDEFAAYNRMADEATQTAIDQAQRRILADFRRVMRAERNAIREEVTAQVMAQPVYQAREYLMRGKVPEGLNVTPAKFDLSILKEMYGDAQGALWRRLPFGKNALYAKAGGVHPDRVAELFGFDSGDALVQALAKSGHPDAEIAAQVEQRVNEQYGEFTQPGAMEQAAFDELHNDTRGRFIETELAMLARRQGRKQTTPAQAARQFAQVATARKKIRQAVKTGVHAAAEAKAARTAERAMVAGDFELASKAKREQLLNHYLYRASNEARTEVTKGLDYLNKFGRKGTRENLRGEFLEQLDALLERFDLRRSVSDTRAAQQRQPLSAWVAEQADSLAAVAPDIPEQFLNEGFRRHYRELTLEEFRGLVDTVRQLEALARREQKAYMAIRDMSFAQETEAIIEEMRAANPQEFDLQGYPNAPDKDYIPNLANKMYNAKDKALAEFLNVENLLQLMTDGKMGQLHASVFGRLSERADWKASKMQQVYAYFKPLFDQYTVRERLAFSQQGHYIESIDKSLTKENALVVALHYGNEQGRARLSQGHGWSTAQVRDIMGILDAKDWKLADGIWRVFDDILWPDLQAVNLRTRGTAPPKVEPMAFDTPHGPARGGYFKISYDGELSERQHRLDENSAVQDLLGGNVGMGAAKTRQGSSTQRLEEVKRAMRLDLGVMSEAINETVHDVAFREAVADTWRILNTKNVQNAIKAAGGTEVYRSIVQRLRETAAPPRNPQGFIENAIATARKNTLVVAMGASVKTALVNVTGIFPAMAKVSPGHFARSLAKFYSPRMAEHYRFILERSEYMRNRHDTYERDLQDSVRKLSVRGSILPEYAGWFALISYVDKGTSAPTWLAAYQDALRKHGNDEQQAIKYADHIVRQTHGSGRIVDLAQIQSGHGGWGQLKRAFTMFYSYFNAQLGMLTVSGVLNSQRIRKGDPVAAARLAADVTLIVVLPAVLAEMAAGRCGDEPKEWGKCVARSTALYVSAFVPIWRDVAAFGWGLLDDDVHSYGFRITPAESYFEGLARGAGSVVDVAGGEGNKTDVKNIWLGSSYLLGLPGYQVWRTIEGLDAWMGGNAGPGAVLLGPPRN
tara:strand:+ start:157444 stop:162921 length:5478 start_codon:yes stop_codon:yes gene_type:complete